MKVGFGLCATTVVWAAILALGGFVWIRDEFGMRAATGAILLTAVLMSALCRENFP